VSEALVIWVILERPRDFPHAYVVRRHAMVDGMMWADPSCIIAPTLEAARAAIPHGLTMIPRFENDDPAIVETWI